MPPKRTNSTLVAFDAEASKVAAVPDTVDPFDGISTLVVGAGLLTFMPTPKLAEPPSEPEA